ncbi:alpha/beta hydrolase fold domain-containing protein [Clostridium sp. MCC353]|uniref:alpha/beta hydrolase fold domain-containing protein n=1 Tax=Clostridium sp. MCC353 TaxID=2592646 RepID=UPI001C027A39|nr:alpha/beta hydrolase fold domain-containing protein [Clostridium sp. MCC353]MBT9777545.1 alpha/beta hydrolase fold domain-containing protein [Clostridium sp. MCC353]
MAFTEQEKEAFRKIIQETGGNRETMLQARYIPDEYREYLNRVERETVVVPAPLTKTPVTCYVSTAKDRTDHCPVHINCHGGGFYLPQNQDDDMYCAHLAAEIKGIVVDVDYALCPDYQYPTAFLQSYEAVKWAFSQCEAWGADPKRVSMGGHSAGGNLTAAVALKANRTKEFQLCLQILDFAALDLASFTKGEEPQARRSRAFNDMYSGCDETVISQPYYTPVLAEDSGLKGLPETLVIAAGICPFKDMNLEYGTRIAGQGSLVTMKCFANSHHGFTMRMLDEWQEAQQLIISKLREASL